jgi:hypothetical protein
MPRKAKNIDDKTLDVKKKKNLLNTIVKDVTYVENEDIILQLPISVEQLDKNANNDNCEFMDAPKPYEPDCFYINESNTYNTIQDNLIAEDNEYLSNNTYIDNTLKNTNNCYWCCHPITDRTYGMPYKYNVKSDTYILFGNFCSLECSNAYNFSSHCGSDKVWEINSLIQMLSKHYGASRPIRPAPSRFLLKIFNGPMTIEEFRKGHFTNDKTHLLNLPPMISTNYNYEIVNTSYLKNITDNMNSNLDTLVTKKTKGTIGNKLKLIMS